MKSKGQIFRSRSEREREREKEREVLSTNLIHLGLMIVAAEGEASEARSNTKAGPFSKKYPRDRLKLERSSRGVNSLLKRLFLTRNCLKLVYTDTAGTSEIDSHILSLSLSLSHPSLAHPMGY